MKAEKNQLIVEPATLKDVPQLHALINRFATRGKMLGRPLSEIYENIRDFFVVRGSDGLVAGCGALHICWADLAEIKAVAVGDNYHRTGVGSAIVQKCIDGAREMDIPSIFCLTYEPDFFARFGFQKVGLMELPRKVWGECQRCPKYPDCDETAMILDLEGAK